MSALPRQEDPVARYLRTYGGPARTDTAQVEDDPVERYLRTYGGASTPAATPARSGGPAPTATAPGARAGGPGPSLGGQVAVPALQAARPRPAPNRALEREALGLMKLEGRGVQVVDPTAVRTPPTRALTDLPTIQRARAEGWEPGLTENVTPPKPEVAPPPDTAALSRTLLGRDRPIVPSPSGEQWRGLDVATADLPGAVTEGDPNVLRTGRDRRARRAAPIDVTQSDPLLRLTGRPPAADATLAEPPTRQAPPQLTRPEGVGLGKGPDEMRRPERSLAEKVVNLPRVAFQQGGQGIETLGKLTGETVEQFGGKNLGPTIEETAKEIGRGVGARSMTAAPAPLPSPREDPVGWALGVVAQSAPTMLPIVLSGGAGGMAAAARAGATLGTVQRGQVLGSLAASYLLGVGDVRSQVEEAGWQPSVGRTAAVLGTAVPYAALDALMPQRILRQLGPDATKARSVIQGMFENAFLEGGTEGAQSFLSQMAAAVGTGRDIDIRQALAEAGAGAVAGTVLGGAATALGPRDVPRTLPQPAAPAAIPEPVQARQPVVEPVVPPAVAPRVAEVARPAIPEPRPVARPTPAFQPVRAVQPVRPTAAPTLPTPSITERQVERVDRPSVELRAPEVALSPEQERLARAAVQAERPGIGDRADEMVVRAQLERLPQADREAVLRRSREISAATDRYSGRNEILDGPQEPLPEPGPTADDDYEAAERAAMSEEEVLAPEPRPDPSSEPEIDETESYAPPEGTTKYSAMTDAQLLKEYAARSRGLGLRERTNEQRGQNYVRIAETWSGLPINKFGRSEAASNARGGLTQSQRIVARIEAEIASRGLSTKGFTAYDGVGRSGVKFDENKDLVGRGGKTIMAMSDAALEADIRTTMGTKGYRDDPVANERLGILYAESQRRGDAFTDAAWDTFAPMPTERRGEPSSVEPVAAAPEEVVASALEQPSEIERAAAPELAGASGRVRQIADQERSAAREAVWQKLTSAPADRIPSIAATITPTEAQAHLDRLRAAPGNNPALERALTEAAVPRPANADFFGNVSERKAEQPSLMAGLARPEGTTAAQERGLAGKALRPEEIVGQSEAVTPEGEAPLDAFAAPAGPFTLEWGTRAEGHQDETFDSLEEARAAMADLDGDEDFVVIYDGAGNEVAEDALAAPPAPPAQNAPLATYQNEEDGIQAEVRQRDDGRFAVTLLDTDSGERLGTIDIFPERAAAEAHAKKAAGLPAVTPAPAAAAAPAFGSTNRLVTNERVAELEARIQQKLGQLNTLDPEMVAIGAEMTVYYIEGGVRKFADVATRLADKLGTSVQALRPYMRSWYDGARARLEDAGVDVSDMDSAEQVRTALSATEDGGVVSEPTPEPTPEPAPRRTISLKKAEGAALRERLGLDALEPAVRESFDEAWEQAAERGLADQAIDVAKEAVANKRPLTTVEHAGAVQKAVELIRELEQSRAMSTEASQAGNDLVVQQEINRTQRVIEELNTLTAATDRAGSEAGRALAIRKLTADIDTYSLAAGLQEARKAKKAPLTQDDIAEFENLSKTIAELTAQNEALTVENQEQETKLKAALAQTVVQIEKERATKDRTRQPIDKLKAERADLTKQLAALGLRLNDVSGVSADGLYLIGKLAVNHIRTAAATSTEQVTLDRIVANVLADLNNPAITERDIYEALNARDPKRVVEAKGEAEKQVAELKKQARLLVQIENAEQGIFDPKRATAEGSAPVRALKGQMTALRNQAYQSGMDAARLERVVFSINEIQDQLTEHKRNLKGRRQSVEITPELAALQNKLKALRAEMRTEDQLSDLQEQLRTGDLKIPAKRVAGYTSPELERNQIALTRARREWKQAIEAKNTKKGWFLPLVEFERMLQTIADASYFGRQMLFTVYRHPVKAVDAFGKSLTAMFDKNTAEQIDNAWRQQPEELIRAKSGLDRSELSGGSASAMEENFHAALIDHIPGLRNVAGGSARGAATVANILRNEAFDDFLRLYPNATHDELTARASAVNVLSGRGSLAWFTPHGRRMLGTVLFAPKFTASRVQAPWQIVKYWALPRVRKEITKDYAAMVMANMSLIGLASLAGLAVGNDGEDPDWGKIRFGDTRIDLWAGMLQPARLVWRLASAAMGAADPEIESLAQRRMTEAQREGRTLTRAQAYADAARSLAIDPLELLGRFSAFKISPAISIPRELWRGQTAVGDPATPLGTLARAQVPMILQGIYEAAKTGGAREAGVTGALQFIGIGAQTYKDSEEATRREIRRIIAAGRRPEALRRMDEWTKANPDDPIRSVGDVTLPEPRGRSSTPWRPGPQ